MSDWANNLEFKMKTVLEAVLEIERASNEKEACEAAIFHLALLDYPSVMLSFLVEKEGVPYIVARAEYATKEWIKIAPLTKRRYDLPIGECDLLPAVLKRRKSKFIQNTLEDDETETKTAKMFGAGSQYVVPLATDSMDIGTLQVNLGVRKAKSDVECILFDALAAHLSVAIERHRTLAELEELNIDLINQAQLAAYQVGATGTVHDLKHELDQFRLKLRAVVKKPENVAAAFLSETQERVDNWITKLNASVSKARDFQEKQERYVVQDVVKETIKTWVSKAKARNCKLRATYDAPGVEVFCRSGALMQILACLIVNSIEAKARNVEVRVDTVTVARSMMPGRTDVRIVVSDTGVGIPVSWHSDIHHFGWTSKGEAGHGMGLTIVNALVTEMGGHFRLLSGGRSCGNLQTEFGVMIPALPKSPSKRGK